MIIEKIKIKPYELSFKKEYKNIEPQLLTKLMRSKYIIDAANCLDPNKFIKANFKYSGIGVGIKN